MALGTAHVILSNASTAKAVPALWADEITATYKKNLVAANLVKKVMATGKKGDTMYFPKTVRGTATAKSANTAVTFTAESGTGVTVSLDQHWHAARLIEDIVAVQGNASLRSFYTDDIGEALARKIDDIVLQQFRKVAGGDGTVAYDKAVIGSDGSTLYTGANEAALTDAGFRRALQTLDDNDVPVSDRFFIVPPVTRNTLMGLARFTEQAFTGESGEKNVIRTGRMGNLYGVEVYVTSQCETATGDARIAPLFHKDAVVLVMQQKPRVQSQYTLDFLGTQLVADTIFGANELRNEAGIAIAVTA